MSASVVVLVAVAVVVVVVGVVGEVVVLQVCCFSCLLFIT